MGEMSQGGYNPNNNRVGTGRDGVGMRKCLRSVNLRVKSGQSRTIPTLPIFSLKSRKIEINSTCLQFKLKVRGEPWLSLTFPSDLSQKASRKVKENRGKSRRNPDSPWFLSAAIGQRPKNYLSCCCSCCSPFGLFPHSDRGLPAPWPNTLSTAL